MVLVPQGAIQVIVRGLEPVDLRIVDLAPQEAIQVIIPLGQLLEILTVALLLHAVTLAIAHLELHLDSQIILIPLELV